MNHAELVMRRRNVLEFIKADPIKVAFTREGSVIPTAAGGRTRGPSTPLDPQTARIVLNKRRFNPGLVNSEAGNIPNTDYLLIGTHRLDIEVNDSFKYLGETYKVDGLFGARTESVLAAIILLGPDNS